MAKSKPEVETTKSPTNRVTVSDIPVNKSYKCGDVQVVVMTTGKLDIICRQELDFNGRPYDNWRLTDIPHLEKILTRIRDDHHEGMGIE